MKPKASKIDLLYILEVNLKVKGFELLDFFRELSQIVWEVNSFIIGVVVFGLLVKFALWGYKESKNG